MENENKFISKEDMEILNNKILKFQKEYNYNRLKSLLEFKDMIINN